MIGIVDYGMGNLRSVKKAFDHRNDRFRSVIATRCRKFGIQHGNHGIKAEIQRF